jgi:hypothetical protein
MTTQRGNTIEHFWFEPEVETHATAKTTDKHKKTRHMTLADHESILALKFNKSAQNDETNLFDAVEVIFDEADRLGGEISGGFSCDADEKHLKLLRRLFT